MSIKRQVAHGMKWQAINIVGRQLLSLVVFTTLARLLDPSAFGMVGLVGVYLALVGMFADQGIGLALIQRQYLEPKHLDTAYWFNTGCALVLCLATIALAEPVSKLLGEPRLIPLLRWSSLSLVIGASASVHGTLLVKAMDFRRNTILQLVANLAGGAVGVGMALAGCGVWALVGQQLAGALGGAIFLWTISPYRPSITFSISHLRDLIRVSSSVFASSILWFVTSRLDQIVIGRFMGVPALGLYVIAGKVPDLAKVVTHQPITEVSLPALSKLQGDHPQMRKAIYTGMELNAILAFAVFVGIASVAPDLIPCLFGAKWAAAAGLCSLLSLYSLVFTLQVFIYPTLLASGGVGRYVFLSIGQAIGVAIACLVGVKFGLPFLVVGMIVNCAIITVPALLFIRQRIGLSPWRYCQPCVVPACASLFMFAMIWLVGKLFASGAPTPLTLTCKVATGAVAYVGFLFVFKKKAIIQLIDTVRHSFASRANPTPTEAPAAAIADS
jgi:O-antigen/teichoic acid export membrane protein